MSNSANHNETFDKAAFEQLFREYFKPLTAFAFRFVKDTDAAKSIVHDAFTKLWEKRSDIDLQKSVKSYLYTSVNNRSLNYIRDNKKFSDTEIPLDNFEKQSVEDTDSNLQTLEIQSRIDASLATLPPKCRKVFELSRYEDKKYKEIADELNISVKTVEAHMAKALKTLRENLSDYLTVILFFLMFD